MCAKYCCFVINVLFYWFFLSMYQMFKTDEISSYVGVRQRIMLKKEQYSRSSTCLIDVSKVWLVVEFQSITLKT
jgi:hypothetical protein